MRTFFSLMMTGLLFMTAIDFAYGLFGAKPSECHVLAQNRQAQIGFAGITAACFLRGHLK